KGGSEQDEPRPQLGARHRDDAPDDRDPRVDGIAGRPGGPHREALDMRLPPELLEPTAQMLSGPALGVRPGRPRPELVDQRLSLGEGVHAHLVLHASRYARGGIRTHTPRRTIDFESIASAVPPPG